MKQNLAEHSLDKDELEAECRIYKRVFSKQDWSAFKVRGKVDMGQICEFVINHHSEGAPVLSLLYKVAVTAGSMPQHE